MTTPTDTALRAPGSMAEELDVELHEQEDGTYLLVSRDAYTTTLPDEQSACAFQRGWRELHGIKPMTGEWAAR